MCLRVGVVLAVLLLMATHPTAAADATNNNTAWTVPIELKRGRVMVPLTINGSQPLTFLLDTGYGINMIHPEHIEPLKLRRVGSLDIVGIAGREEAGMYDGAKLNFGAVTYAPKRIASLPSEAKHKKHEDGILGVGFFKRYVVELDGKTKTMRLYEPKSFDYSGKGEILKLDFPKDTPVVEVQMLNAKGTNITARMEIDTGCDWGMCLGSPFVKAHNLLGEPEETRSGSRQGVGGGTQVRYGHIPQLKLGRFTAENVSTSFFTDGSPVDDTQAGHIGMPTLLKFRVIFDYSRKRMILEENP